MRSSQREEKNRATSISRSSKEEVGQTDLQHAWVDRSVWAFVNPHVWSVSEWRISQLESFSPTSQCHLRCSCPCPLAQRPQVYGPIHYLPITMSIVANHSLTAPGLSLPFLSFLLSFNRPPFCCSFLCSLITVVFQFHGHFSPIINLHNMPITYYWLPQLQLSWNSIIIFVPFCLVIEAVECVSVFFSQSSQLYLSVSFSFFVLCVCVTIAVKLLMHSLSMVANRTPH